MRFSLQKGIKVSLLWVYGLMLMSFASMAQVVNIEQARVSADSVGWTGKIQAGFQSQHLSEFLVNGTLRASVQKKDKKHYFLFLTEAGYAASKETEFTNYKMAHLRFSHKLYDHTRMEAFVQIQQNKPLGIQSRMLMGMGPRIKLWNKSKSRLYFGTVAMAENETDVSGEKQLWQIRSSSYLTFFTSYADKFSFSGSLYYQPLFSEFSDYRISGQYAISIALFKQLRFFAEVTHFYDSKPPSNAFTSNLATQSGIAYEFGGN